MNRNLSVLGLWVAALFLLAGGLAMGAEPGALSLQAQLVWGTDGAKPNDPKLRDLDPALKKKLAGVFKWKDYYEVDRQMITVPMSSKKRVRMSPKCDVEVDNLGDSMVEVKLFGEGKLVVKKKQALKPEELLVLAGDDKDNTAWFVVLSRPKR